MSVEITPTPVVINPETVEPPNDELVAEAALLEHMNHHLAWPEDVTYMAPATPEQVATAVLVTNGARIGRLALRFGADSTTTDDVTQEVFLRYARHPRFVDPETGNIAGLATVVRQCVIDSWRRTRNDPIPVDGIEPSASRHRSPAFTEHDFTDAVLDRVAAEAKSTRLGVAMASLTKNQRTVLEMLYYQELTHTEISQKLGIPMGTVKSRAHYALHALRRNLVPPSTS